MSYHNEAYEKRRLRVEAQVAMEAKLKSRQSLQILHPGTSDMGFSTNHNDHSVDQEINMSDDDRSRHTDKSRITEDEQPIVQDDSSDSGTESIAPSSTSDNGDSVRSQMDSDDCLLDFYQMRAHPETPTVISMREAFSFELMRLLDEAGSPRFLYDKVNTLLRKYFKNGFQIGDVMSREILTRNLFHKYPCPDVLEFKVGGYYVYKLPFVAMLQNLIDIKGSCMYSIDPDIVCHDEDYDPKNKSELWNTQWMKDTFNKCETYRNFQSSEEIMLPLIIYMDKTGTDKLQRYSLEPVLFTTAAIPREQRNESSWRHLGFLPPCYKSDSDNTPQVGDESQLQLYHNILGVLLSDLIHAQKHPPLVTVIDEHGQKKQLRARLPVMIVMGDQKSQDTLCGRKHSNSGGAGRVHRSCMCSYLTVDDPEKVCVDVCGKTIKKLTQSSLVSDVYINSISAQYGVAIRGNERRVDAKEKKVISKYLQRQRKMNEKILQYPFTQHAIRNAFDDIDFGSWGSGGILKASFDDFMHSTESGLFEYIGELVFEALTKTEKSELESAIRKIIRPIRSSAKETFPRWQVKDGFTNMSRMTCAEKVGCVFIMALTFQYLDVLIIIGKATERQIEKYLTFPKPSQPKSETEESYSKCSPKKKRRITINPQIAAEFPFCWEKYMPLDLLKKNEIENRLEIMARHGFDLSILNSLDSLQIHALISHCNLGDCTYPSSYPKRNIPNQYIDLKATFKVPEEFLQKALMALTSSERNPDGDKKKKLLPKTRRYMPVEGTEKKHYRMKPKHSGVGNTSAILTRKTENFQMFTEYLLTFHAFCRYSYTLPNNLQENYDLIDFGSRTVVQYFEKMLYRGDDSLDSRTTKVHANMRAGLNHKLLGTMMHADCQVGERMLKTKAKGISSTAQQRGSQVFEKQTMERIREEIVFSQFGASMTENKVAENNSIVGPDVVTSTTTRHKPNFCYIPGTSTWTKLDRKGRPVGVANIDNQITKAFLKLEPTLDVYELYGEVELTRKNSDQIVEKTRIRATPDYCQSGAWYDFVQVRWLLKDSQDQPLPPICCPGRCLGFYQKKISSQPNKIEIKLMALVHGSDVLPTTRDTLLTSYYFLQYNRAERPVTPKVYAIPIEDILHPLLCVFCDPHQTLFDSSRDKFMAVRPRKEWAYVWMSWNKALHEANNETNLKARGNKFVNLSDHTLVDHVRKEFNEMYTNLHHNTIRKVHL